MIDLTLYNKNKMLCRKGDVVVYRGSWLRSLLTGCIEALAPTESHASIVFEPAQDSMDVVIAESTRPLVIKAGDRNGVQLNPLPEILGEYPGGSAALLRLSASARAKMDWVAFDAFVNQAVGTVHYDVAGLFEFLLRDIPIIGAHIGQTEKTHEMYCCAFVIAALTKGGLLNGLNWSQSSPEWLVQMGNYEEVYVPMLGNPKLVRYNSLAS